jgi:hypothetical protein
MWFHQEKRRENRLTLMCARFREFQKALRSSGGSSRNYLPDFAENKHHDRLVFKFLIFFLRFSSSKLTMSDLVEEAVAFVRNVASYRQASLKNEFAKLTVHLHLVNPYLKKMMRMMILIQQISILWRSQSECA